MSKHVLIYTSPTCGPCKQLKPELMAQAVARGFSVITVEASFDTQAQFQQAGVRTVPTVVFEDDDVEIDRFTGFKSPAALAAQLTAWGL